MAFIVTGLQMSDGPETRFGEAGEEGVAAHAIGVQCTPWHEPQLKVWLAATCRDEQPISRQPRAAKCHCGLRIVGKRSVPPALQLWGVPTAVCARTHRPSKCTRNLIASEHAPLVLMKAPWSQPVVVSGPCLNRKYWRRDRFFRFAVPGCKAHTREC